MPRDTAIGVSVIGLGFMGRTHVAAYQRAAKDGVPCRIVALCDTNPHDPHKKSPCARPGNIDTHADDARIDAGDVAVCVDIDDFLATDGLDLVSVCTPTDTHVDIAIRALAAGKHVLVEKPVALAVAPIERLIEAARVGGRICTPAMCMRFWPGWTWLKEVHADGRYGPLVSAHFTRTGARPSWGRGFYDDPNRCGDALFDMHVHDVDFIHYLLGTPTSVQSAGTASHVTTLYTLAGVVGVVVAEGGWLGSPGVPFRMRYVVEFAGAVADFDLSRDPQLIVHTDDGTHAPQLPPLTAYDYQVRHAIDLARGRDIAPIATLEEEVAVTRTLLAEKEALGM